jgi:hypothetical protein
MDYEKMKKLFILGCALLSTSSFATVSANTVLNDSYGKRMMQFEVSADHSITITNSTVTPQNYTYTFTLCPEAKPCDQYQRNITLTPGQTHNDHYRSHVKTAYARVGNFTTIATTECVGGERLTQQKSAMLFIS